MSIYRTTDPYLYVWRDNATGKLYAGIHNGSRGYSYIGSGVDFKREYRKRPEDFERIKIVHNESYEYIRKLEVRFLKRVNAVDNDLWYNKIDCYSNIAPEFTEEWRQKISESKRGVPVSESHRRKLAEAQRGKRHSEETRRKMSLSHKGQKAWNKGIKGYKRPRTTCEQCGKEVAAHLYTRWHGDNCRSVT